LSALAKKYNPAYDDVGVGGRFKRVCLVKKQAPYWDFSALNSMIMKQNKQEDIPDDRFQGTYE
jgi:hypothetical protein